MLRCSPGPILPMLWLQALLVNQKMWQALGHYSGQHKIIFRCCARLEIEWGAVYPAC